MLTEKSFYNKLDLLSEKQWFVYLFPLFCILTILFFNCPYYEGSIKEINPTWVLVFKQAAVIFPDTSKLDPTSHEAKMTFRLTIPLLIKLFSIRSRFVVYGLQIVVAWFFFYLTRSLLMKILHDRVLSFILTLAIAFIYTGEQFVTDIYGAFDCFTIFFILLAMYYNNALAIFICVSLAVWTDERGGLMSLFIIPWILIIQPPDTKKKYGFRELRSLFDLKILSCSVALVLYMVARFWLQQKFSLSSHMNVIKPTDFLRRKEIALFGLWEAFEGLWPVVLLSALCFFKSRDYFLLTILAGLTAMVCYAAFSVADITRSMTYLFPLLIISVYYLAKFHPELKPVLTRTILYGFLICILTPTYHSEGLNLIHKNTPLILRFLK